MPTNQKRSSMDEPLKIDNPLLVFRLAYLFCGVALVFLSIIKPHLWLITDGDSLVSFPLFFGMVFLVIAYALGKGKSTAKWGAITTVVLLVTMTWQLRVLSASIRDTSIFLIILISLSHLQFILMWVFYFLGLNLLLGVYSGKNTYETARKAVTAAVILLALMAIGWLITVSYY